jgi:transposase
VSYQEVAHSDRTEETGVAKLQHSKGLAHVRRRRGGATHFLMKTLPRVASEMALHVLAYNLTRVMNIMGIRPLMAAMRA